MTEQIIVDPKGKEVKVGSKVRYVDDDSPNPEGIAEVIEITDWDGDVDDDTGRSISIEPRVKVRYPSGIEETWRTSEWEFGLAWESYPTSEFPEREPVRGLVEELVVVE